MLLLNHPQGNTMSRVKSGLIHASAIVLAVAGLTACGSLPGNRAAVVGESLPAPAPVVPAPQDEAISQNVRVQLAHDVPLAEIDVRTAQGKVKLRGTVDDAESARKAVKGALAIEGVRGVVNDLDVAAQGAGRGASLAATAF